MKLTRENVDGLKKIFPTNKLLDRHIRALCDLALTALSAEPVAEMVDIEDGLGTVFLEFYEGKRPPAGTKLFTAPPSLLAENKRMREALEFYADPESWKSHPVRGGGESGPVEYECPIGEDHGEAARAALREPK